ncbi:ABC-three component system middle component 6 [Acinetobacter gyllenbergii]|uniref:ABC-three component system middle component 6 n=1 Tax=Acinetobacter gyllenbergii TaxID=134534 RepID=UPI003F5792F9
MPNKHILFSNSLLAVAGLLRSKLVKKPLTIDELWLAIKQDDSIIKPDFTEVVLATNILYAIQQLTLNEYSELVLKPITSSEIANEID